LPGYVQDLKNDGCPGFAPGFDLKNDGCPGFLKISPGFYRIKVLTEKIEDPARAAEKDVWRELSQNRLGKQKRKHQALVDWNRGLDTRR
jgi:hypothetical protein